MFFQKKIENKLELANDTIKVELINAPTTPIKEHVKDTGNEHFEFDSLVKLLVLIVATTQACLIIFGYMEKLAVMEAYNIQRSEVSFSIQDLLAGGYAALLSLVTSNRGAWVFGVGLEISAFFLISLALGKSPQGQRAILSLILSIALVAATYGPILFYITTRNKVYDQAAKSLNFDRDKLVRLSLHEEFPTPNGSINGKLILTSQNAFFILKDHYVYKLKSDNNQILRKTRVEVIMEP
nr:hypothetical protein [Pseudomonas luteola]